MWCLRSLTVMVSGALWSLAGKPSFTALDIDTVSDGALQRAPVYQPRLSQQLPNWLPYSSCVTLQAITIIIQPEKSIQNENLTASSSLLPVLFCPGDEVQTLKENKGSLGTCLPAALLGSWPYPPLCVQQYLTHCGSPAAGPSCRCLCLCYNHHWSASPISLPCIWPIPAHPLGVNLRVTSRKSLLICNCTLPILI